MRAARGFVRRGLLRGRLCGRLGDGRRQLREVDVRDVDVQPHGRAAAAEAGDVGRQIEASVDRGRQGARVQPATRAAAGDGRRQRQRQVAVTADAAAGQRCLGVDARRAAAAAGDVAQGDVRVDGARRGPATRAPARAAGGRDRSAECSRAARRRSSARPRVDGDALAIGGERQAGDAGCVAQADARGADQRPRRLGIADRQPCRWSAPARAVCGRRRRRAGDTARRWRRARAAGRRPRARRRRWNAGRGRRSWPTPRSRRRRSPRGCARPG